MKWKLNSPKPEKGDFRFKIKFAWIPTNVIDYHTNTKYRVWLEWYEEKSVWSESRDPACTGWFVVDRYIYVSKFTDTL